MNTLLNIQSSWIFLRVLASKVEDIFFKHSIKEKTFSLLLVHGLYMYIHVRTYIPTSVSGYTKGNYPFCSSKGVKRFLSRLVLGWVISWVPLVLLGLREWSLCCISAMSQRGTDKLLCIRLVVRALCSLAMQLIFNMCTLYMYITTTCTEKEQVISFALSKK